jgi:hypothetical protein
VLEARSSRRYSLKSAWSELTTLLWQSNSNSTSRKFVQSEQDLDSELDALPQEEYDNNDIYDNPSDYAGPATPL